MTKTNPSGQNLYPFRIDKHLPNIINTEKNIAQRIKALRDGSRERFPDERLFLEREHDEIELIIGLCNGQKTIIYLPGNLYSRAKEWAKKAVT